MIFLDTSFLTALTLPRDALHGRAVGWANAASDKLITTDFVLCEFFNSLSRPEFRDKAHETLRWLRDRGGAEIIEASRSWVEAGLKVHAARSDKAWSLTDCISFERDRGIRESLTNDHHFEQAGFDALLRRDPPKP